MRNATGFAPPVIVGPPERESPERPEKDRPVVRFDSLVLSAPASLTKPRSATLSVSLVLHAILIFAVIVVPIMYDDFLPAPGEAVRAFFVAPAEMAPPPPPPPPPPAAGVRQAPKAPAVARPDTAAKFVAPVEVPDTIKPEESLDLMGVEGGVPGGVEGGVPGGVVGGIVGGLPAEAPPPPTRVVRVGGQIKQPKLINVVQPRYPELAIQARVSGVVILEALVDTRGRVKGVKVLRPAPLFDEAAVEAVKQWRYMPLLLNGEPTEFILTVTVNFNLKNVSPGAGS